MKTYTEMTRRSKPSIQSTTPKPFLKWPGGKTQLLPDIRAHLPSDFKSVHEVFAGSAAVSLDMRARGYRGTIYLYDLNNELIKTYRAVQRNAFEVAHAFARNKNCHCREYFHELRSIDWRWIKDDFVVAGRMLYLNRACYNGLYRINASGRFNSAWGKKESITFDSDNLHEVCIALQNAQFIQNDFASVLDYARPDDFVYIDPPYPGGFTAYTSVGFDNSDHKRLHRLCNELTPKNIMFMQSNADCPFIRHMYKDFNIVPVQARRSINCKGLGRGKVGEILITNY